MKIIYTSPEGGVHVVTAADESPANLELLRAQYTDGVIVANDVLPSDRIFRDAWIKSDSTVYEDLELSRTIALNRLKGIALTAAGRAQELEDLFETPINSSASIRTAYLTCKAMLNNASTVEDLKECITTFRTTFEVVD